jgi:hypothetical protein
MRAGSAPAESDAWTVALSTWSTTREKVLEHRFIAEVTAAIWRAGRFDFSVSHSEVDNSGYDVIIEVGAVIRHIQLKAMQISGTRRDFGLQVRLADKPSACAVLMIHDTKTLEIKQWRLFAGLPGAPIPSLGDKPVKHTKGDQSGFKAVRPALRNVPFSAFMQVSGTTELVRKLFGDEVALGMDPAPA